MESRLTEIGVAWINSLVPIRQQALQPRTYAADKQVLIRAWQ